MLKMVLIAYNEVLEQEVRDLITTCMAKPQYTKIVGTFGKGTSSGTHEGSDVWPGRNNMMYVACTQEEGERILAEVTRARKHLGQDGLKAFLQPLDAMTE